MEPLIFNEYFFSKHAGDPEFEAAEKVSFNLIAEKFQILDEAFEQIKPDYDCIYFHLQNRLNDIIILYYFIERNINFLIGKDNDFEQAPAFCDYGLNIKTDALLKHNADIAFLPCPGYVKNESQAAKGSGNIFLVTSGSTGKPKYVKYNSANFKNNALNCVQRFKIDYKKRILITIPVNHMFGLGAGLLPGLLAKATISLVEKPNIIKIINAIKRFQPDVIFLTPAICKMLLALKTPLLKTEKIFISAGESISTELAEAFETRFGRLINLYGSTELGAVATTLIIPGPDDKGHDFLRPMENVQVKIDPANYDEIICRHNAGFDYYVSQTGDVMESKLPGGWHKTGDYGALLKEDLFAVKGRIDGLINRHGFLLSVTEIEHNFTVLTNDISQAVVFQTKPQNHIIKDLLVAVCLVDNESEIKTEEITKRYRDKYPRYMVPDKIFFTAALPRLNSGKPDRVEIINKYSNL